MTLDNNESATELFRYNRSWLAQYFRMTKVTELRITDDKLNIKKVF